MNDKLGVARGAVLSHLLQQCMEHECQNDLATFVRRVRVEEALGDVEIHLDDAPWVGLVIERGVLMVYDRRAGTEAPCTCVRFQGIHDLDCPQNAGTEAPDDPQ